MKFLEFFKGKTEERRKHPGADPNKLALSRAVGSATRKDAELINRWKEHLKQRAINPTDRLLSIAQYDLEQSDIQIIDPEDKKKQQKQDFELQGTLTLANLLNKTVIENANMVKQMQTDNLAQFNQLMSTVKQLQMQLVGLQPSKTTPNPPKT